MNKLLSLLTGVLLSASPMMAQQFKETIVLHENEIHDGYFVKRVQLQQYAKPEIRIHHAVYRQSAISGKLPTSAAVNVLLGKEKKKPFALLPYHHHKGSGRD